MGEEDDDECEWYEGHEEREDDAVAEGADTQYTGSGPSSTAPGSYVIIEGLPQLCVSYMRASFAMGLRANGRDGVKRHARWRHTILDRNGGPVRRDVGPCLSEWSHPIHFYVGKAPWASNASCAWCMRSNVCVCDAAIERASAYNLNTALHRMDHGACLRDARRILV